MYPLKCKEDSEHVFETSENGYKCTKCGVGANRYYEARQEYEKMVALLKEVMDFTNGTSEDILATAMLDAANHTHRTLQQNFFRTLILFIQKMKDMPTDARNEASVEWCKQASKIESYLPRI